MVKAPSHHSASVRSLSLLTWVESHPQRKIHPQQKEYATDRTMAKVSPKLYIDHAWQTNVKTCGSKTTQDAQTWATTSTTQATLPRSYATNFEECFQLDYTNKHTHTYAEHGKSVVYGWSVCLQELVRESSWIFPSGVDSKFPKNISWKYLPATIDQGILWISPQAL
jgi:hypothetical protein